MVSSEVQRTLVKSPPELWAELSDPAALARHLGQLGEIRITRTEPEKRVDWEAERTSGTVLIKPSGWGTKVTLSATRETGEPEQATAEPTTAAPTTAAPTTAAPTTAAPTVDAELNPAAEPRGAVEPDPEPTAPAEAEPAGAEEPTPEAEVEPPVEADAEPGTEPEATPEADAEVEPRRGFFSRLFGRRRQTTAEPRPQRELAAVDAEPGAADEPQPASPAAEPEPEPVASEEPPEPKPDEAADLSAELEAAEEVAAEEVTAVLTAVLDRLGAAHHRPFSRA
jgi:hypothetical protein